MSNKIEVFEYNDPNARFGFTPNSILNLKEMDNKKQNSIDWLVEEINKQKAWADPSKLEPIIQQAKAMHKEEIVKAYNRDVINKKQNWFIENGERYYNLHYKGDQVGISDKEDQVGESGREIKIDPDKVITVKPKDGYSFEIGV